MLKLLFFFFFFSFEKKFEILIFCSDVADLLKTEYEKAFAAYSNTLLPQPVVATVVPQGKENVKPPNVENVEIPPAQIVEINAEVQLE